MEELQDVFPTWATDEDKLLARESGLANFAELQQVEQQAAASTNSSSSGLNDEPITPILKTTDISDSWEKCPEYLGCVLGFFFNELACTCLASDLCRDKVCPDGEDLDPTASCKCATYEMIKSIYPQGSTQEEVTLSWEIGLIKAQKMTAKSFKDGDDISSTADYNGQVGFTPLEETYGAGFGVDQGQTGQIAMTSDIEFSNNDNSAAMVSINLKSALLASSLLYILNIA